MESDIYKIEQYVNGTMPADERRAFEAAMADDAELAAEVDAYRLAEEAVELSIEDSLREQLKEWRVEEASGHKSGSAKVVTLKSRPSIRRILAIAAGVLVLLLAGSYLYVNTNYSAATLADAYLSNDNPLSTVRTEETYQSLTLALEAMRNADYEEADLYLNEVADTSAYYYDARFYLGLSHYLQDRPEEAISTWQTIPETANSLLNEKVQWYTILAYLKTDQPDTAELQPLLQTVTEDPDHAYYRQAQELSATMSGLWYNIAN